MENKYEQYEAHDEIFTIPNLISFIRLCMIPVVVMLILDDCDVFAIILFAITAGTDWVDGQIARRTNSVSKLGQLLDPAVDRLLVVFTVLALLIIGRLPLWIIAFVLVRDFVMLAGGFVLLNKFGARVPVVFAGKLATTLLYFGFGLLIINIPLLSGLGWCDISWLPLFNADPYPLGFCFVYAGLLLSLFTSVYYMIQGVMTYRSCSALKKGEGVN